MKMVKSIRILLLLALLQISLSSCLLWTGPALTLKQSSAYFLVFLAIVSSMCAGMNYLYTPHQEHHSILNSMKRVRIVYSILLLINLAGACLVLSETVVTKSPLQQELADLFLPSFFFLFGIDLYVFLPIKKYIRDLIRLLDKKNTLILSVIATVLFLQNPLTILSIVFYMGLGILFAHILFPKSMKREISFYGHVIRDILFVISILTFF